MLDRTTLDIIPFTTSNLLSELGVQRQRGSSRKAWLSLFLVVQGSKTEPQKRSLDRFYFAKDTAVDSQGKCRQRANKSNVGYICKGVGCNRKWGRIAKVGCKRKDRSQNAKEWGQNAKKNLSYGSYLTVERLFSCYWVNIPLKKKVA